MIELVDVRQKMEKVLEFLRADLQTLRTGRASPVLIERIIVEAYETKMPLIELATISVPSPNELLVTPFDQIIIKNIERALALDRGLGLNPIVEQTTIRLRLPPLTEERRKELVKLLGQKLETARIMVRQARSEKMREIREAGRSKEISEDVQFRAETDLQKITDEFNQKIEEIGDIKEAELLEVG